MSSEIDPTAATSVVGGKGAAGRIARGLAANVTGNGVTLFIQLVTVPVFLSAWGVPVYGEWLILSAFPFYLSLSDLSFSTVAGTLMTMLAGSGKRDAAVALGRQAWSIVTLMSASAVLVAIVLAIVLGGVIGEGAAIPGSQARIVLAALLIQVAIGNQYGVLDAWYRTGGRYPLGVGLRQLSRLLEAAALVSAVLLGARPDVAAVATVVASVVGFCLSWFMLRRAVPWVSYRLERPRGDVFRQLVRPGVAYLAFPLGNALSIQGLTIVVGTVLGPGPLVVFSTTRTATRVIIQVLMSINLSVWPELSRSMGAGDLAEARTILRRAVQLAFGASLTLALALAAFGTIAIRWWTRGNVDPPVGLLAILLIVVVANSVWFTLTTPLAATNRHTRMAVVFFASTSVAVALAIPLCILFGLVGAAVALLAIDLGMLTYVLPAAVRIVEDEPRPFLRAMLDVGGALRSVRALGRSRSADAAIELARRTGRPD